LKKKIPNGGYPLRGRKPPLKHGRFSILRFGGTSPNNFGT